MVATISPPRYLILEITTECNFKCKQCHQWMTKETTEALPTSEKLRAVKEIAALNPTAKVILTGGETMLKYDEFFAICEQAKKLDLQVISNTNGSYINKNNALEVLKNGPDFLILSLDSHIEKLHRFIRGNAESYQHLIEIIPHLVEIRNKHKLSNRIYTHSIIFEENISLWSEYIEFARKELKVDAVYFQLLKETLRNQGNRDPFFDKHFFKDTKQAELFIYEIANTYRNDSFMGTNAFDLALMKKEIHNPQKIELGICNSAEKNIFIDAYGWSQLCLHMNEIMPKDAIGNYRNLTLSELWKSKNADDARQIMQTCTKNCGMLNCHRKTRNETV